MQNSSDRPAAAHKATRRIWAGGIVAGLVVAAIAGGAVWKARVAAAEREKAKQVVPLDFVAAEVARPVMARMPLTIEFSGPLVAPRTAVVRAKAAGTLLALNVAEGSRVKAGQVIGTIDIADLQSRAADRAALVESAQANLIEAERQNTANVGLAAQNFISRDRAADLAGAPRRGAGAAQVGAGAAGVVAGRHQRGDARGADRRHRRQAPRRPGREGERRAADRHRRRPGDARARRLGRHARDLAARAGPVGGDPDRGQRERRRRPDRPHRARRRGRDAGDRRRRRPRQPGRALSRRPVRAGAGRAGRRRASG